MKKICFIIGDINKTGGTERVTSLIASKLSEFGYNVSILSLSNGDKPYFYLHPYIKTYTLQDGKVNFKKRYLSTIVKLRCFITKHDFNTVIVVDSIACLFTIPALWNIKKVNHICWEHFNFKTTMGIKSRTLSRKLAAKYCNTVITLTERDKDYWSRATSESIKIVSIPNPTPFPPLAKSTRGSNKSVLAIGRLTYQKGFDLLLTAWIKVNKKQPGWVLNIIGDGEDESLLRKFIATNNLENSVNLLGRKSNVSDYYAASDIFCLSSRFEGFPMVLLETLSFGIPVVSFDCDTGPSEILRDTGSLLVPAEDTDSLAQSLLIMMDNEKLREDVSKASIKKSKIYQPDTIISQWIKIIES